MAEESLLKLETSLSSPVTNSLSTSTFLQPLGVAPAPQHVFILMPIQLTKDNYLLWKSLFIPFLKAHDMLNLAEGREHCPPQFPTSSTEDKKEDPAYTNWIKRDQIFLTWINATLSASLLRYTIECTSGRALWLHLENLLAASATSRVLQLKAGLQKLYKHKHMRMEKYLELAQQIADELEAAGSPVDDCGLVFCILEGLPPEYYDLVASIRNRRMPITSNELHGLLLRHEIPIPTKEIIIFFFPYLCIFLFSILFVCFLIRRRWSD
ncbi:hypothetical protein M0R45_018942 [Rubus argutus]|uniref:Retrotransposon Copia-like N-terminal domain-containing protein n=1 Tax=Rubus argutus TaxID=59490 RepID=A0AAW1X448_RUBAR